MGAYTSRHSRALSRCFWGDMNSRVERLCIRSANLIIMTRISWAMAMSILRRFSACSSSFEEKGILSSFVTPSISRATSRPNSWVMSSRVQSVSSTTSCRSPATTDWVSMPRSTSIAATERGWIIYGSPELRFWPLCLRSASRKASAICSRSNSLPLSLIMACSSS